MLDRLSHQSSVDPLTRSSIDQLGCRILRSLHKKSSSPGTVTIPQHVAELPQTDPERLTPRIVAAARVPLRKKHLHQSRASLTRRLQCCLSPMK